MMARPPDRRESNLGSLFAENLRCEYLINPLGIDVPAPRLSWVLRSERRAQVQSAYQILVASNVDALADGVADLWDSGRVPSAQSAHIAYAGRPLLAQVCAFWKVRVWDGAGSPSAWSEPASWSMGLLAREAWAAAWVTGGLGAGEGQPDGRFPVAQLRKTFLVDGPIRRALAYVSALGVYEFRLNGRRVGDHILAPEWTDYTRRVQYQTYDVTDLLTPGPGAAGALLGDGWYAGQIGLAGPPYHDTPRFGIYGHAPKFIAQIEIELADGRRQTITTDESWRITRQGPITFSDLFEGEHYDARREMPGWDMPGYDDSAWEAARLAAWPALELVAQPNEPIRVTREVKPVALTEPEPGVFIFDLGQNMVGWARFEFGAARGVTLTLRYGEALTSGGSLYTENLRGASQTDRYTFQSDGPESFEPHFTYHGFRYVEVKGLPGRPALDAVVGRVFNSASPEVGQFACSSPLINQLMDNILWTQRANLMGVPTDCPQRDERCGWMGDIQVFCQTACFNMDLAGFLTKFMRDVRDGQDTDGAYANYSPRPYYGGTSSPGWADAGVIVPWRAYQNYGDTRLLAENFASAKRWIDYVHARNPDLVWRNARGADFNDWLNADTLVLDNWPATGGAVPKEVYATAFFAYSTELLGKMAAVLGRGDEARLYSQLAADIKVAFNREFVSADGSVLGNTQAGYALALHFDLLPAALRDAAVRHMVAEIERYGGHMSTGIQSTLRLMLELTRAGQNDLAYQLIHLRSMPSWGYSIDQGATTIWERWDGYVQGRGFQDASMNSLNHYALGAVGEWVWRHVAGINPDEARPGFQHVVIHPRPGGGLTWAKAEFDSIHGRISTHWQMADDGFQLELTIPANTAATVYVPVLPADALAPDGRPRADTPGVRFLGTEAGAAVFAVGSGRYTFRSLSGGLEWS
jgi:alpha-L-rhamnosidase